jgi:hypothetical protein
MSPRFHSCTLYVFKFFLVSNSGISCEHNRITLTADCLCIAYCTVHACISVMGRLNAPQVLNSSTYVLAYQPQSMLTQCSVLLYVFAVHVCNCRVRQRVIEKTQQWGPQFSLVRQFEFHDPHTKGFVTTGVCTCYIL